MTDPTPQPFIPQRDDTNGTFWTVGGQPVRGKLVAKNKRSRLALNGYLTDDPRVIAAGDSSSVTKISRAAVRSVAASLPRDLFGQLDSGEAVSMIHAQNFGGSGLDYLPEFRSPVLITGGHVTGKQLYRAVRFRLDQPYWTLHLSDGERAVVPDDGSVISVKYRDAVPWLVYECADPTDLRGLTQRVVSGCAVLGWLMWDQRIVSVETEVQIDAASRWLSVRGRQFARTAKSEPYAEFLPRTELTVDLIARWIALNSRLDGLAWAVHELRKGAVQVQTILGTSLIEGYHRRLDNIYDQKKVVTRPRKGGGAPVQKREPKSFYDRTEDVLGEVADVVPDLIAAIPDCARVLTNARNDIAHHSVDTTRSYEERFVGWTVVTRACPWILRVFLLVQAGIDREVLRSGLAGSSGYEFACANTARQAAEAGLRMTTGAAP